MKAYWYNEDTEQWVLIENQVVQYPSINYVMDAPDTCSVVLGDFEGAMFDIWHDRDFTKMKVEDKDNNVIFVGYLIDKQFAEFTATFMLIGFSAPLEWESFIKDYILAEGKITDIDFNTITVAKDNPDSDPFNWDADYWITEETDVGLMIIDNTKGVSKVDWDASAHSFENAESSGGTFENTLTKDISYCWVSHSHSAGNETKDQIIYLTIDGDAINIHNTIQKIKIYYKIMGAGGVGAGNYGTISQYVDLDIYNYQTSQYDHYSTILTHWHYIAVGEESHYFVTDGVREINIKDIPDLKKYLNSTFNQMKLKFVDHNFIYSPGAISGYFYIDYVKVNVEYNAVEIVPIMKTITDSGANSITCGFKNDNWQLCEGVVNWGTTGNEDWTKWTLAQGTRSIVDEHGRINICKLVHNDVSASLIYDATDGTNGIAEGWIYLNQTNKEIKIVINSQCKVIFAADGKIDFSNLSDTSVHADIQAYATGWHHVRIESNRNALCYLYYDGTIISDGIITANDFNFTTFQIVSSVANTPVWLSAIGISTEGYKDWKNVPVHFSVLGVESTGDNQDRFKIGQNTNQILADVSAKANIAIQSLSELTHYMARNFRGTHCIDAFKSICELEGLFAIEDHANEGILLVRKEDMVSSGVSLTQNEYDRDWKFDDKCNQVKEVEITGNAFWGIYYNLRDPDENNKSRIVKQIINEEITTIADAELVAQTQLDIWKVKQSSIILNLKGTYPAILVGYLTNIAMVRPTVAAADYPVRRIERKPFGKNLIITTIYAGLGSTPPEEMQYNTIMGNKIRSRKALINRLIGGAGGPAGIQGPKGEQGIQGIQGDKGDKGDIGEVSEAELAAAIANLPIRFEIEGLNGFVPYPYFGLNWDVAVSDSDAIIVGQAHVKKGGTFKLKISFSCTGLPLNNKIRTITYLSAQKNDEALSSNLINANTTDWLTSINTINDLYVREWGSTVTIDDDENVGVHIAKTNNDSGAGNLQVRSVWLEPQ